MTATSRRRVEHSTVCALACLAALAIGAQRAGAVPRSDAAGEPSAAASCRQADALVRADQLDDALKAFEAAIAADPTDACGARGLESLAHDRFADGQPCPVAAALHRAGDDAAAKVILSDAIKSSTDASCATER